MPTVCPTRSLRWAKCGHSMCAWNKWGGSRLLIFYQHLCFWQEKGQIEGVGSRMEENGDLAGAPRLLEPVAVLWWGGGGRARSPAQPQAAGSPARALAPAGSRLLLPALLYIVRLTHSSPSQLQPNLSKAARAPQALGLGLGRARVYFRHLSDTLQGHWSGHILRSPLISGL